MLYDLDDSDRQMLILATAELALRRPGWDPALSALAVKLEGPTLFVKHKILSRDVTKPEAALSDAELG